MIVVTVGLRMRPRNAGGRGWLAYHFPILQDTKISQGMTCRRGPRQIGKMI